MSFLFIVTEDDLTDAVRAPGLCGFGSLFG
jgi:hypothetical protein